MKKKSILLVFMIILLLACKKSNIIYNWDNVNSIVEDCVLSFIDQEKIYDISLLSWGTTDYGRNLDKMYINILFNQGNYKNEIICNNDIKNSIVNKVFDTFSNLNPNKNILKIEDVKVFVFYPFKIIYTKELNYSEEEKENINKLLWDEFEMTFHTEIYKEYCEGWIEDTIDYNNFFMFMQECFDDDIIIEL
jgi:hypothetical protein